MNLEKRKKRKSLEGDDIYTEFQKLKIQKVEEQGYQPPSFVQIKTFNGQMLTIPVDRDDIMLTIKNSIECAYGIPVKQQRFIFKGKVLGDLITVENAGLDEDSVIHMVFSLVGGYQFLPKKDQMCNLLLQSSMNGIPDELLSKILTEYISDVEQILNFGSVCKRWYLESRNDLVWKKLSIKNWPNLQIITPYQNPRFWTTLFIEKYIADKYKDHLHPATLGHSYMDPDCVMRKKRIYISQILQSLELIEPCAGVDKSYYFGKYNDMVEFLLQVSILPNPGKDAYADSKLIVYGPNGRKSKFVSKSWSKLDNGLTLRSTIDFVCGKNVLKQKSELIHSRSTKISDTEMINVMRCMGIPSTFPYIVMWIVILVLLDFFVSDYGDSEGPLLTLYRRRLEREYECLKKVKSEASTNE